MIENPHSGREKQVFLTPKGERFLATMVEQGALFLERIVEQLTEEEIHSGIQFLSRVTTILERGRVRWGED